MKRPASDANLAGDSKRRCDSGTPPPPSFAELLDRIAKLEIAKGTLTAANLDLVARNAALKAEDQQLQADFATVCADVSTAGDTRDHAPLANHLAVEPQPTVPSYSLQRLLTPEACNAGHKAVKIKFPTTAATPTPPPCPNVFVLRPPLLPISERARELPLPT